MKLVRKLHLWLGMLFAPSIIFFAFSGALQICGLHEGEAGEEPAAWIAKLALIHKDQMVASPRRAPRPAPPTTAKPPEAPRAEAGGERAPRPQPSKPLKAFFLLMAAGLIGSTVLGIYMAFGYRRDRRVVIGLLVVGTVAPIAMLFL